MEERLSSTDESQIAAPAPVADLSALLINLLKSVLYRDGDERQWAALLNLQARVRDYAAVLNLDLALDEAEGYAFLRSKPEPVDGDAAPRLPRLVARRPLSYPVSLLLALLRKKLAEFDAGGGDTRLVLSRDDIVELARVFLPDGPNEARLIDQIESTINKVVELGFLHKLKPAGSAALGPSSYEVRRILKAFVDAQWLSGFDARLDAYQLQLTGATHAGEDSGNE
ncbi:MAG: DUF4194 domain-containing protein [Azoarcus sp.]|jgi:hypothetical protein|nr:DUF4194 domain-containing protein [Azoarcus sp.]